MALNEVTMQVQDGGLGVSGPSAAQLHAKVGCAAAGTVNEVRSFGDPATARTAYTAGPLARALGHAFGATTAGRRVARALGIRAATGTAGYCGPVRPARVASSTGVVTVAGAAYDRHVVRLEITASGARGAARFRYSLDDGNTWSPDVLVPSGGSYALSGTNVTVTFGTGSYDDGDVFYFRTVAPVPSTTTFAAAIAALWATVQQVFLVHLVGPVQPALSAVTSTGTSPPTITLTGTPADWWDVRVKATLGGARGTWLLQYSLDGGASYNGTDVTSTATYDIPETGITLNIASGNATDDNVWTFDSGNAAGVTAVYNALKTAMESGLSAYRYAGAVMEAPRAPDASLTAVTDVLAASPLLSIAGGFVLARNALDSRVERQSAAWPIVARLAAIPPGEQPLRRAAGPLALVDALDRDERVTPALDAAGLMTLRTVIGRTGAFIEKAPMRAAPTSDVRSWVERRVLDVAQTVGRDALLDFQGESVRVASDTGYIDEGDAVRVEKAVERRVRAALAGQVSDVAVSTTRDNNILTTQTLLATIAVTPLGYANSITGTVALVNPTTVTV